MAHPRNPRKYVFVFSPIIYKFNFSWNELVELGSSAESSPMMTPPSGRLMRHSDPINDVLVSQITGRIAFILQPLSRSVAEVSNLPPIFFILTLLFLAHQGSQRDEGDSSKRMSSLHPNDEDKTYPKCSVSCTKVHASFPFVVKKTINILEGINYSFFWGGGTGCLPGCQSSGCQF